MEIVNQEYKQFISKIKTTIQTSQIKAHLKVNEEMLRLYWSIADMIVKKQKDSAWGDKLLERISNDLQKYFPNLKGFSLRNIKYMKQWFLFYVDHINSEDQFRQQAVAQIFQIPWGHNVHIVSKAKDVDEALFYINITLQNNYSRAELVQQIAKDLYSRSGKAITNFENKMPSIHSKLAQETLKDPYNFDFLDMRQLHDEKELEDALVNNITKFLLELGQGFSFLGRQYKITVDGTDFKIDLLFYHVKLHCYVVIELKVTDFKPEYAGKLNFYISAVDGEIKSQQDNPTIGILICKSKSDIIVEYALKDMNKPIGVSEYMITEMLPKEYQSSLPTIEQIEAEIGAIDNE